MRYPDDDQKKTQSIEDRSSLPSTEPLSQLAGSLGNPVGSAHGLELARKNGRDRYSAGGKPSLIETGSNRADLGSSSSKVPDRILTECAQEIQAKIQGEVRIDPVARLLYSTDASIYQIEPLGVIFPRCQEDLAEIMKIASDYGVPVLARGAGSSLAGQSIGPALILDCSRHLNRIISIDPQARKAVVEPGVVLNHLNRELIHHGLQFGPDPASAERATLGGCIANNATGAHSIQYGMAADHLLSAQVILADGSQAHLAPLELDEGRKRAGISDTDSPGPWSRRERELYRAVFEIRDRYADSIREHWPKTWRRASGYNLNYLLPWSPDRPPFWDPEWFPAERGDQVVGAYPPVPENSINLAPLLAGSEGTLALFQQLTLNLVPIPKHTILAVLPYPSLAAACEEVPRLLYETRPAAIELIPKMLVDMARSVPAYAGMASFLDQLCNSGDTQALLAIEFSGDDPKALLARAEALGQKAYIAADPSEQKQVWGVRKVGLGLLLSRKGDEKPAAFIEDLSVPVDRLGEFVAGMEKILKDHGTSAEMYAHASAGCLHIRPLVNLKSREGVRLLREIATEAVNLTLGLEGSVSGEHGDGLARSEWLEKMFGPEILPAFRLLKQAADPQGLLNPGKILDAPSMDANLRYGENYQAQGWETRLDFSSQGGLAGAVEQCNGAGVCRKSEGVMCPSFQATQDEMHSTRGRANLLRAMLSGRFPPGINDEKTVYQALELCLACKGCKAECPSGVDMAKLKYEFLDHYYSHQRRPVRDYLFAFIDRFAGVGHPFALFLNPLINSRTAGGLFRRFLGLALERPFPRFETRSLYDLARRSGNFQDSTDFHEGALFLADAFSIYFYPQQGLAALNVLKRSHVKVSMLRTVGAGRTLISKGFLEAARRHARKLVDEIYKLDPEGKMPVIGIEPSEILTLRDEYLDLLPDDKRVQSLAQRALMIDEFLVRPGENGVTRIEKLVSTGDTAPSNGSSTHHPADSVVFLHGHCYQKAQPPAADRKPVGTEAAAAMLKAVGYQVKVIDTGCCGMAGAFGNEREHYDVSMKVAEKLLSEVKSTPPGSIIASSGVSCKAQIEDGASRQVVHPIELVEKAVW